MALGAVAIVAQQLIAVTPSLAQSGGGYGDLVDWVGWARVDPTANGGLASSYDRTGGPTDANQYESPAGLITWTTPTVATTVTGPGILSRFWMPHASANSQFALRLYFDGETTPRIDTTSDAFLGGSFAYFAAPLVTTCAGGQVSYEPIPFRESLRIETENHAGEWHWYHWSYRTFPPGAEIESYNGVLDAETAATRERAISMFENVGEHAAGPSATAITMETGSSSVPGGSLLPLADLAGPGIVRRLSLRMADAPDADLDSLALRVTVDEAAEAAIDVPVSWFFGAGHGRAPYKSLPLGTDSPDGFYCDWPMPFRSRIRIEAANRSAGSIPIDGAVVEYEPGPIEPNLAYLHVAARKTIVAPGQTLNIAASVQGVGHYVGNLLFIQQNHDTHFFLEGDERLVVDGASALRGTGIEDAYNGGFYYNWVPNPQVEPEGPSPPFAHRPLSGILKVERTASPEFARADQYRWQIGDRVPFTSSFELSFETQYCWAGCQWISVVFYYLLPPQGTSVPWAPDDADGDLGLRLLPPAPNPAKDAAIIRFRLSSATNATLELVDLAGRRVRTIVQGSRGAGLHEVRWLRGDLAGGVYFVRLRCGDWTESRKLVVTR